MPEQSCSLCAAAAPLRARGERPRGVGRLAIDHEALRRELGGRPEILDALPAKATGRPSANAAVVWRYFTTSVYQSGDLPWLATREALQNSRDAIAAAVAARKLRAGEGRFSLRWDGEARSLTWEDNGIGMDADTILGKFLVIGESGKRDAASSDDAAGGFGVAKAVILGASTSFRWEMHTRDNLAVAQGAGADVEIFDAPPRAGTRITIHDVSDEFDALWDRARGREVAIADRLRELLAANDLPELRLEMNGLEVRPMFSRRGGAKVEITGSWGPGTTAQVKAYRRPPGDRGGAYYVRLNGLFQFLVPSQRGGLKVDVVVDLRTAVRPGQAGYPLNAARDALQDRARWAFQDLVEEVERENESTGRADHDEVFDPDSDDPEERAGAAALGDLLAEAFADADLQRALADAAGGIMDFYAERLRKADAEEPVASLAPAGSRVEVEQGPPRRGPVLPPGFRVAQGGPVVEADIAAPSEVAAVIRSFLAESAAPGAGPAIEPAVDKALEQLAAGTATSAELETVEAAIERANDGAMAPGGAGLLQVAVSPRVVAALHKVGGGRKLGANPFGRHAGLRISRKTYDRARAARFKKSYGRWLPYLVAWDGALRLIAAEARIRRAFKPGFVLDDTVLALTARTLRGNAVLYVHPDKLAQVVRAHRERPVAIAAYLHGLACHELTHLDSGRLHASGHDERFIVGREDLGAATGHLLPAIAVLVQKVLRLPEREDPAARRLVKISRDLDRARDTVKELRGEVGRLGGLLDKHGISAQPEVNTPGTRLRYTDLAGWLEGWTQLSSRRISADRYAQRAAHLAQLPDAVIAAGRPADLDALEAIAREARPAPGLREGHPSVRVLDAIDRARAQRGVPGGDRAGRLLGVAIAALRARPPEGVDAAYLDGFVTRNRAALLGIVRGAFGGAA